MMTGKMGFLLTLVLSEITLVLLGVRIVSVFLNCSGRIVSDLGA